MPKRTHLDEAPPQLLKPAEAMARLRVSRQTLARYVDAGHLSVVKLPSGHRRYPLADVEALERGEVATA